MFKYWTQFILRDKIIYYTIKFYEVRSKTRTKEKKNKNRKVLKENIKIQKERKRCDIDLKKFLEIYTARDIQILN